MKEIETLTESDFGFGLDAHACDLKSSLSPTGATRSYYQAAEPIPELAHAI